MTIPIPSALLYKYRYCRCGCCRIFATSIDVASQCMIYYMIQHFRLSRSLDLTPSSNIWMQIVAVICWPHFLNSCHCKLSKYVSTSSSARANTIQLAGQIPQMQPTNTQHTSHRETYLQAASLNNSFKVLLGLTNL